MQQQQTAAPAGAAAAACRIFSCVNRSWFRGSTIEDVVDDVAADCSFPLSGVETQQRTVFLSLTQSALADAVTDKKLFGIVHPYVADALANRLQNRSNDTFHFSGLLLLLLLLLLRISYLCCLGAPAAAAAAFKDVGSALLLVAWLLLLFFRSLQIAFLNSLHSRQQHLQQQQQNVGDRDAQFDTLQKRRYLRPQSGAYPRKLQGKTRSSLCCWCPCLWLPLLLGYALLQHSLLSISLCRAVNRMMTPCIPLRIFNDLAVAVAALAAAACTWAFEVEAQACRVSELKSWLQQQREDVSATNVLSGYDIQGEDSLYLYTLEDPEATTVVCCSSSSCCCNCSTGKLQHKTPPPCCCCFSSSCRPSPPGAVTCCSMTQHHTHAAAVPPRLCPSAAAGAAEAAACCCFPDPMTQQQQQQQQQQLRQQQDTQKDLYFRRLSPATKDKSCAAEEQKWGRVDSCVCSADALSPERHLSSTPNQLHRAHALQQQHEQQQIPQQQQQHEQQTQQQHKQQKMQQQQHEQQQRHHE
ncbi:hypothetical protein Emed_003058 [Eimeria media]